MSRLLFSMIAAVSFVFLLFTACSDSGNNNSTGGQLYCKWDDGTCLSITADGVDVCNQGGGRVVSSCGHTHSFGDWTVVTPASCEAPGVRTRICSCGETQSEAVAQLSGAQCNSENSVTYEGQTYRTVTIGTQTWMAENLNYNASGSKCYGEDGQVVVDWDEENDEPIFTTLSNAEVQANCIKYGRLYDWAAVMGLPSSCNEAACVSQVQSKHCGICPVGWHIPNDAEWETLVKYVDPDASENWDNNAGTKLKSTNGWNWNDWDNISGNGTDEYGFSALPGGDRWSDGDFRNAGYYGRWWSATEYDATYARYWRMRYNDDYVGSSWDYKTDMFSLRCVRDFAAPQ